MAKKSAKIIKFPNNFSGRQMAEAAEKRPSRTMKKSVAKNKPGAR